MSELTELLAELDEDRERSASVRQLSTDEYDLLRSALKDAEADKARMDFVERMGRNANWIARNSSTGRGYRLHNSKHGTALSARAAIDDAMNEASRE